MIITGEKDSSPQQIQPRNRLYLFRANLWRCRFAILLIIGILSGSCDRAVRTQWNIEIQAATESLDRRDFISAETSLAHALALADKIGGESGQLLESRTLPLLWWVKARNGKEVESEALLKRNIDLDRRIFGSDSRELAYPLKELGRLQETRREYGEARSLYLESLRIDQKASSPKSFSIAETLWGLGRVEIALMDTARGDSLFQKALEIYRSARLPDSRLRKALEDYSTFLQSCGRFEESVMMIAERDSVARIISERKRQNTKFGNDSINTQHP